MFNLVYVSSRLRGGEFTQDKLYHPQRATHHGDEFTSCPATRGPCAFHPRPARALCQIGVYACLRLVLVVELALLILLCAFHCRMENKLPR